jgi:hypothetical protein
MINVIRHDDGVSEKERERYSSVFTQRIMSVSEWKNERKGGFMPCLIIRRLAAVFSYRAKKDNQI